MPNRNTFLRLRILDELLSNPYKSYNTIELAKILEEKLAKMYPDLEIGISQRTVEKDLRFIKNDLGMELDKKYVPNKTDSTKLRVRYKELGETIFQKRLTHEEKELLEGVFALIGQFEGLPKFSTLEQLRMQISSRNREERQTKNKVISFTKNPLGDSTLIGTLFTHIVKNDVLEIKYHAHFNKEADTKIGYPYLLKEYNNRWYLVLGMENEDDKELQLRLLGLDRIENITIRKDLQYVPYEKDIFKHFDNVIGVTVYPNEKKQEIKFWVSNSVIDYLLTKPLHETQAALDEKTQAQLSQTYPDLANGKFYTITCKYNYELIRELTSFGKDLIVLSPPNIVKACYEKISQATDTYNNLKIV